MRTILAHVFVMTLLIFSCEDSTKDQRVLPNSNGNINALNVVIDNKNWDNEIGETVRQIFGAPVKGLPQDEPLFTMSQIPPSVFSGFARKNRTVLKIEKGNPGVVIENNVYARPQLVITLTGNTKSEIINELKTNSKKLVDAFTKEELGEKQRRIGLSIKDDKAIEETLGISLKMPTAYRVAKQDKNFFWLRKTTSKKGTIDMMLYELPMDAIRKGDSAVIDIVEIRNAMGKKHIKGENKDSYMITETAYTPYFTETIVDNKPTYETKGIWDMKNDWMSGPFINYTIEDKINNRYVVLEGYAYAPSVSKRDYIFELEAILKSVSIK